MERASKDAQNRFLSARTFGLLKATNRDGGVQKA